MKSPETSVSAQHPAPEGRGATTLPVLGLALLFALSLCPLSSTRIQTWPFSAATAAFWLLPVLVAGARLALGRPHSRLGGLLDAAFAILAVSGIVATAFSPIRAIIAPFLLPFLGALALPYALLPLLRHPRRADPLFAAFAYPLLIATAAYWISSLPSLTGPWGRNAHPFGHANTTGSVCAAIACWLAVIAVRSGTRTLRFIHFGGVALSCALAASSSSRGAVIALAAAAVTAAGLVMIRRGRIAAFVVLAGLAVAATVLTNARLRERVISGSWSSISNESNAQRVAMIRGGFDLAARRPATGWGPGAVPYVFPSVRETLPGTPDNYLQLHNTPAQIAATLGLPGLIGAMLLLVALFLRVLPLCKNPDEAPLIATVACASLLLLFDHSFATPAFAVLTALPVAALAAKSTAATASLRGRRWLFAPLAAILAALAVPVGKDLAARAAWDSAIDAAVVGDSAAYASDLRRARELAPADPFYGDQLAAHLATGHPFPGLAASGSAAAIAILRDLVAHNPAHESAHYNLGWLLLESRSADFANEAAEHFTAAALLAPSRGEVYLGLALARISKDDTDLAADALAAEILLDPAFTWSPRWRDAPLGALRPEALARAADFLSNRELTPHFAAWLRSAGAPVDADSAYRRLRTGHGVLYGHPDGPPLADVNVLFKVAPPPAAASAVPPKGAFPPSLLLSCARLAP